MHMLAHTCTHTLLSYTCLRICTLAHTFMSMHMFVHTGNCINACTGFQIHLAVSHMLAHLHTCTHLYMHTVNTCNHLNACTCLMHKLAHTYTHTLLSHMLTQLHTCTHLYTNAHASIYRQSHRCMHMLAHIYTLCCLTLICTHHIFAQTLCLRICTLAHTCISMHKVANTGSRINACTWLNMACTHTLLSHTCLRICTLTHS